MSDSELSDAPSNHIPPDAELERSLREAVVKADAKGEEATVNTIRSNSEKELGLESGFYNSHEVWKARSKEIIRAQFERLQNPRQDVEKHTKPSSKTDAPNKLPVKRPSPASSPRPRKKPKSSTNVADNSDALSSPPISDEEDGSKPNKKSPKKNQSPKSAAIPKPARSKAQEDSDSDLSSLIDDEPAPKKRGKSKDGGPDKTKKSKTVKPTSTEADPDQEEIKRLQGWLVKCGIRKVWGKELKPFETSKARIKHLKQMLTDVGMTGRYSNEKASQVKEARELAADLEAVQEGNERWGKNDEEDEDGDQPRTRRLIRGSKHYDFLSSDGEETD